MEIFSTIGQTVKKEIIKKAQKAQAFGLMTDEATDISVTENLVTYIQFYCQDTGKVETFFPFMSRCIKKAQECKLRSYNIFDTRGAEEL